MYFLYFFNIYHHYVLITTFDLRS